MAELMQVVYDQNCEKLLIANEKILVKNMLVKSYASPFLNTHGFKVILPRRLHGDKLRKIGVRGRLENGFTNIFVPVRFSLNSIIEGQRHQTVHFFLFLLIGTKKHLALVQNMLPSS